MYGNKKLNNPFVTTGYAGPEYFCDRETESRKLIEALRSGRNMALISLRRMGKTGLLKHLGFLLQKQKEKKELIYIDLLPTQSASDMLSMLGTALLHTRHKGKNPLEKIISSLSSLRPGLSYDSLSGQPSLVFTVVNEQDFNMGFRHLLSLFDSIRNEPIIVFDEFQQIRDYPEKNAEALLRTIMQENPQIRFIFSGSDKHMMEGIFTLANRPFYQSVEMMYLGPVPAANYREFIRGHFSDAKFAIADAEIDEIIAWCRNHTFYIQYFCNRLFDSAAPVINHEMLHQVSLEILSSYEPLYLSYQRLLTDHQFSLLRAIAVENGVTRPLSGDFISKYQLKGASSVKTSLVALSGKQMLIEIDKAWVVYDVFFARWLEHTWRLVNIWKA